MYVAIFAMVAGMFTGILVIILRVEGQQSGLVEVSEQMNFAMNRIQSLIRESNLSSEPIVGVPPSFTPTSLLTLVTASGSQKIERVGTEILVNGTPITTGKVKVGNLKFTKYTVTNPSAEDIPSLVPIHTIEIEMTVSNSNTNPQNEVTRTLKSSASPIAK